MAMTLQLLDYLTHWRTCVNEAGDAEERDLPQRDDAWENADDAAHELAYELEELQPLLESEEFVDLLESWSDRL